MSAVTASSMGSAVAEPAPPLVAEKLQKGFGIPFWVATVWLGLLAFCAAFSSILPIRKTNDPDFLLGAAVGNGDWTSTFGRKHLLGVDENGNDLLAYALKGPKTSLYEIRFRQTDIWPDYAGSPYDSLHIDIYEHWLEKA